MPPDASQRPAHVSHRNNFGTLRLVGALAVLVAHAFVLSSADGQDRDAVSDALADVAPFNLGLAGLGVAMFFAISGYLVCQSFVRRGGALAFAEARVLRIYPALWVTVGLTVLVGAVVSTLLTPGEFLRSHFTLDYAVGSASLLDVHYFLPGVFSDNPSLAVNGSLWTLPVELAMYLFCGIAGVLGLLSRRTLFNIALAAVIVAAFVWPDSFPLLTERPRLEIASFFAAGAALYVNRDVVPLRPAGLAALTVLAAALSWTPLYPLLFALAFSYAVLWLGFTQRPRLPDLAARGDLSYATYLFAFPITQLWVSALGPGHPWPVAALTLICTLPLAYLSWHLVETPALRLKGRLVPAKLTGRSVIVG